MLRQIILSSMVLLLCGLICAIPAFADTATYNYDAMNRLTQVKYTTALRLNTPTTKWETG